MTCRTGRMIGLPDMRPSSFRKAMIEPVKVIAPMATPSDISTSACAVDVAERADAEGLRRIERRRAATSTAARPTSEWKAATSCGIAVIGMRRAMTRADGAARRHGDDEEEPGEEAGRRAAEERGQDGERHADHAEEVALPARSPDATGRAAPG